MQKYIWTEKYSVGVAEIDEQHQHFFEMANEILDVAEKEEANTKELALQIAQFAGDWLSQHILVMDKKYAGFMHEKGIS